MRILVTGGAGFIGSAYIRHLIEHTSHEIFNLDKLTYSGHESSVADCLQSPRYQFEQGCISDPEKVRSIMARFCPQALVNFAAETHVDRSIDGPSEFIQTNIVGTFNLLQCALSHWQGLPETEQAAFRFHHISTDEVYGALGDEGAFSETTAYDPRSPYSASKASSDHLVSAWLHTYGLPILLTNCSNNYGPYQFPEKLIPLVTLNALEGKPLPVYGQGLQVRDWLYVQDHAVALLAVLERGAIGETYNIGGLSERRNIDVVHGICDCLDDIKPKADGQSYREQIQFVTDRPGHDFRYAIDCSKIERELGWRPSVTFEEGLRRTVTWYLDNGPWCQLVQADQQARMRRGVGDASE